MLVLPSHAGNRKKPDYYLLSSQELKIWLRPMIWRSQYFLCLFRRMQYVSEHLICVFKYSRTLSNVTCKIVQKRVSVC